jgi:hypothetical protein
VGFWKALALNLEGQALDAEELRTIILKISYLIEGK